MSYVDGFVIPVKSKNRAAYQKLAARAAPIYKEYGALRVVECWGDDVPEGKVTSFSWSVKREDDETVVFSWIEWPSKEVRDAGNQKVMTDPRMQPEAIDGELPFDAKRMIYGGFLPIVNE